MFIRLFFGRLFFAIPTLTEDVRACHFPSTVLDLLGIRQSYKAARKSSNFSQAYNTSVHIRESAPADAVAKSAMVL